MRVLHLIHGRSKINFYSALVLLSQNTDVILPDYNEFTGFVFKLQANLDPRHRDRLAYIRVVSGRYEKGMKVRVLTINPLQDTGVAVLS